MHSFQKNNNKEAERNSLKRISVVQRSKSHGRGISNDITTMSKKSKRAKESLHKQLTALAESEIFLQEKHIDKNKEMLMMKRKFRYHIDDDTRYLNCSKSQSNNRLNTEKF